MGNQWADEAIRGGQAPPGPIKRLLAFCIRICTALSRKACIAIGTAAVTLLTLLSLSDTQIQTAQEYKTETTEQVEEFVQRTVIPTGKKAIRELKNLNKDKKPVSDPAKDSKTADQQHI